MHVNLFRNCLRLISRHLKKDICDLKSPGTLVPEIPNGIIWAAMPPEVRYACSYWVHHYAQVGTSGPEDEVQIMRFFKQDLLHWLETLSIMSRVTEAVSMLNFLVKKWTVSCFSQVFARTNFLIDKGKANWKQCTIRAYIRCA